MYRNITERMLKNFNFFKTIYYVIRYSFKIPFEAFDILGKLSSPVMRFFGVNKSFYQEIDGSLVILKNVNLF